MVGFEFFHLVSPTCSLKQHSHSASSEVYPFILLLCIESKGQSQQLGFQKVLHFHASMHRIALAAVWLQAATFGVAEQRLDEIMPQFDHSPHCSGSDPKWLLPCCPHSKEGQSHQLSSSSLEALSPPPSSPAWSQGTHAAFQVCQWGSAVG